MKDRADRGVVLLDCCVLINLIATGICHEILVAQYLGIAICSAVDAEGVSLLEEATGEVSSTRTELDRLIADGLIEVVELATEEEATLYVQYARFLDDGEAMSMALAKSRGYFLATDDLKARRIYRQEFGSDTGLRSTPGLVRTWSIEQTKSDPEVGAILRAIERRGRFMPRPSDSEYRWWMEATDSV